MSWLLVLGDASITHSYESTHRLRGLSTELPDLRRVPVTLGNALFHALSPDETPGGGFLTHKA